MKRVFPGWWEASSRREQEARMLEVDGNRIQFRRQASIMEIYGKIGYAEGEKQLLWDLPGHGKAYHDCGEIKVKGCDHVELHQNGMVFGRFFKRSCRRKGCPTCFEAWASAEGERSLIRLASYVVGSMKVMETIEEAKHEFRKDPKIVFHQMLVWALDQDVNSQRKKPIHVVLSPPQEKMDPSVKSYMKLREKAYRIAKHQGLLGGAMIPHPYRLKCSQCGSAIPDYEKSCPECHSSEFQWFFSPHFHIVGFGWIHNTKEGYQEHGWVVRNLGIRKSVFWTFQYLLSHAGVSDLHTTTWFGKLAYNVMEKAATLGVVMEICPYCERILMPLTWIGGEDRGPPPIPEQLSEDPRKNDFLAAPGSWRHI